MDRKKNRDKSERENKEKKRRERIANTLDKKENRKADWCHKYLKYEWTS